MIELVHLEKRYGNAVPLTDVNAVINDGDVISIIGPSGTGKSTLIRCIDMLERPTSGEIILDGENICARGYDVTKARRKMGMVFQSFNLFGHLNVIENIMQAQIDILGRSKSEAYETGVELLRRVGLVNKQDNYPDELSGGQKQRVAIARTLAMDPEVILFDEPTSALDPTMVGEVQSVIRNLTDTDKTMLIVTHELNFARAVCSRVFYMDQGGIYEDGTPDQIFGNPQRDRTRRFIRQLRVLELKVDGPDFDFMGAGTEIDGYCLHNNVSSRAKYGIKLAFEELACNILKPVLACTPVLITVEHSEKHDSTEVTATYGGERFDPAQSEDDFSYSVLQSVVGGLSYHYDAEAEQSNAIRILI
ncbi:MAG: amino acid ABC transporter ATP-binding protein [Eggerthellaceae bacterium]|nr:amino acid ABC transporter ATP-binding protein [Eggerthellaceae bacterium]